MAKRPPPTTPRPRRPRVQDVGDLVRVADLEVQSASQVQGSSPSAEEETPDQQEAQRTAAIHEEGLRWFGICAEAERPQRERELDDLWFEEGQGQWPAEWKEARAGGKDAYGQAVAGRVTLTINKVDQPIQQVLSEARAARLGIEIKPKGSRASREIAEVRQGLLRMIEVDSRASLARHWALERAVKCGRGAYRILKAYANDGDDDLDLIVKRILNQHSVYLDPFAEEPDWSDARVGFITHDFSEAEYKRRYPRSQLSTGGSDMLSGLGDPILKHWVMGPDGRRTYRVAEYFQVTDVDRERVNLGPDLGWQWEDQVGADLLAHAVARRTVPSRKVHWYVMDGMEILDEEAWEGRYIPIILVTGKEYNINGERRWKGIVANAKDAQRSYNAMRSAQVEAVALAPKAPWVLAEGQDEGYETMWDQANTKNYQRLLYKPTTFDGLLVPPPRRNVEEPAIQAISFAVREADGDIKATTGRFDPSLGRPGQERSGRAIRELKTQGEAGTSIYVDNLAHVSMAHEARILNDMLEYVYDRPGRVATLLDQEDNEREVVLGQPFVEGKGGQWQMAGGVPVDPAQVDPSTIKKYDLGAGSQYRVVPSVGTSFQTRREEGRFMMGDLAKAAPGLVPMIADLWIGMMDFPGAKEMAARLKKVIPQAAEDENAPPIPPAILQQLQQLQQVAEMAMQEVQALKQQMAVEQQKLEAQALIKREELATRERIEAMKIKAGLIEKRADLDAKIGLELLKGEITRLHEVIDRLAPNGDEPPPPPVDVAPPPAAPAPPARVSPPAPSAPPPEPALPATPIEADILDGSELL